MKPIRSDEPNQLPVPGVDFDADVLIEAARRAVGKALARHKARGNSVVAWQDGRVVVLRPEDIPA